ncbi:MAG: ion channel [Bryobacteraceae bacterium]
MANPQQPDFDPGLTQRYTGDLRRVINKDGSFNVLRRGVGLRDKGFYLHLMNSSWPWFLIQVGLAYTAVNACYAGIYYWIGVEHLTGASRQTPLDAFLSAFFFSVQTFTTVGYGHVSPHGLWTNVVAAFEAMTGLLGFALGTGLLYGRFSRPSAKIVFSRRMIAAPFGGGRALMFRIANGRPNVLMELEATVILMTVESGSGGLRRTYKAVRLDREKVFFLPLTWTLVHPIDDNSPVQGLGAEELKRMQAEFLILIKGFDETFSQSVYARHSYTWDEIEWGRRFLPAFHVTRAGDLDLDLSLLDRSAPE